MSRKKATKRKVKVPDTFLKESQNLSDMNPIEISSDEYLADATFQSEKDPATHNSTTAVQVKTEPNSESNSIQERDSSRPSSFKPAKIKRERLSLDSSICSRSQAAQRAPTMDLGSHFEESLSTGSDLTWSQLLEAKNYPKVHIPEQRNVAIKLEKPDAELEKPVEPDLVKSSTDDDTDFANEKSSTVSQVGSLVRKEQTSLSGTGLSGSSNRFSKNQDGGGKDLSRKAIPPEIRRVLASKYGVESHSGIVVPNFNKSRSRFTQLAKHAGITDSDNDECNEIQAMPSSHVSVKQNSGELALATSSQKEKSTSGITKSKSVSPTDYPAKKTSIPAKVLNRRRFSSSTYERRGSHLPLDHQVADKLQSRGLVDLGSHYGNLLKDSPPPLTGRRSKSPYKESAFDRTSTTSGFTTGLDSAMSASDEVKARTTKGEQIIALARNVRRASFVDDLDENSRSLNSREEADRNCEALNLQEDTFHHEAGSGSKVDKHPTVIHGGNSPSLLHGETHNQEKAMLDAGSSRRPGSMHSSSGAIGSELPTPMIVLSTSTSPSSEQLASNVHRRSPFGSHDASEHSRPDEGMIELGSGKPLRDYLSVNSAKRSVPRSSSTSPRATNRPEDKPSKEGKIESNNTSKEMAVGSKNRDYLDHVRSLSRSPVGTEQLPLSPMIDLGSGRLFFDYMDTAKAKHARTLSRSPVRNDRPDSNPSSPMMELGSGYHRSRRAILRPSSRSPVDQTTSKTATGEGQMIELRGSNRLPEQQRSRSRSPNSDISPANPMIELHSTSRLNEERKSTSHSPRSDSGPADEPMMELQSTGHLHERRGAPQMKPLEAMIDLNSLEPTSPLPLSPGFGTLPFSSFPSQVYRPRQRYPYLSKPPYRGRTSRPVLSPGFNASPGFSPRLKFGSRFSYPSSPRYRIPGSPMIDLASFGKSNELQAPVSSRSSEVTLPPTRMKLSGAIHKRRHSLDSAALSKPSKKPRVAVPDQRLEVKSGESGVRLNVNDLLHLEREEQKYIQDLSVVQSQLTEIRFNMQRMRQDLSKLESSEKKIKECIDVVRAKRVRILKDARDHEGSSDRKVAVGDSDTALRRGSMGFQSYHNEDDRIESVPQSKQKDSHTSTEGKQNKYRTNYATEESAFEKKTSVKEEAKFSSFRENSDEGKVTSHDKQTSRYSIITDDNNSVPSEIVLRASLATEYTNSPHRPIVSTDAPSYPITSSSSVRSSSLVRHNPEVDWRRSPSGSSKEKISREIERFESSTGSTITLNSDGSLVLRKSQAEGNQLARKCSKPPALEEFSTDVNKKTRSEESQQFLGCLEITSTTEEPLIREDDGPKEVLAEKERENLASKLRRDQGGISSTVSSLEIEQDTTVAAASEMDFIGHTDAVCCVLPYKGKLLSASADRTVKAFDLKTGECLKTYEGHGSAVNCLQVSSYGSDTDRLFTGANDQTVRAYNVKTGTCTHKFSFRGRVMCLHVAFAKLFVGLSSGFVAVIDLKTNKCVDQFNCHEPSRISCLASATEEQRSLLCTGSFDSTIAIQDASTGLLLRHIKDHKLTVLCMQVVENILYSGSADTVVQSHNVNTGELLRSYTGHTMSVSGLQALGGVLVTSSLDRIIRCFDIKTGDLLQLYGGNTDMIFSLSVFGDMIYTGCRDGRVSGIKLDLRKYHCCKWADCSLKFGLLNHLKQHVQDHINQTVDFKSCFWDDCIHKFPRGKQLDVIQAATEHILSHVPSSSE